MGKTKKRHSFVSDKELSYRTAAIVVRLDRIQGKQATKSVRVGQHLIDCNSFLFSALDDHNRKIGGERAMFKRKFRYVLRDT